MNERLPSVLVAMSGGVDSSVAAALLHERGWRVLGSHLKLIDRDDGLEESEHGCCSPAAEADARGVAERMGFEFEVVDLRGRFRDTVLADFFAEHESGRTPNPCVRCNEHIKFRAFLERAGALGFDFVATGHYARIDEDPETGRRRLLKGLDPSKDQSYVLHMLGQAQLARTVFPVGAQPKRATRDHAARLGLRVADKPDSQEVCFVPDADHAAFLERHAPGLAVAGSIVSVDGTVLGRHRGTHRYTVGQRRGLGISLGERTYVVEVDRPAGRVVVGSAELLSRRSLVADRVSWIAGEPPRGRAEPFEVAARIRYRGEETPAVARTLDPQGRAILVEFRSAQRAVTPGQSVVLYRDDEVLGGGIIREAAA